MKHLATLKSYLAVAAACILAALPAATGMAQVTSTLNISPVRIAINGSGDLLVSDYIYGQVLTVAPDTLDIIGELNINGRPLGVAWADGFTYVGNSSTGQVEVYDIFGQEQFTLGFGTIPAGMPQDIAIAAGNAYVVDSKAGVVRIFTLNGLFQGTIPQNGYDQTILANPTAIAVDEINQKIYVSDYGDLGKARINSPRIQVFNLDGSPAYTIQSGTTGKYRFTMPQGLTVDSGGRLFVIDALSAEIQVYDTTDGALLNKVKGSGIKEGPYAMQLPLDLVIDDTTNDLYVTNNRLASIKVFAGAGGK